MNTNQVEANKVDILVVDDTPINLRLLSNLLSERGYEVRKAISGKLALLAASSHPPDLILLDIMMPYQNGKEVFKKIKQNEKLKDVPVVFLTNVSAQDDLEQELLDQADKYLIKAHFTPKEVVEEVLPLIKK